MDFDKIEERMNKTLSVLEENFSEIRAGRANPAILTTGSYKAIPTQEPKPKVIKTPVFLAIFISAIPTIKEPELIITNFPYLIVNLNLSPLNFKNTFYKISI